MKASRRFLFLGALLLLTFSAWFMLQLNPNVIFHQFKKEVTRSYQKEIRPLSTPPYALNIREPKILEAEQRFYTQHLMHFQPETLEGLSDENKAAWLQLKKQMEYNLMKIKSLQSDAALYNLGGALKSTLSNTNQSSDQKWQRMQQQLTEAPLYYITAKNNLINPDINKTSLAIDKQLFTLKFLQTEFLDSLAQSGLSEPQQQKFVQQAAQAQISVKDYIAFCKSIIFEYHNSALINKNK